MELKGKKYWGMTNTQNNCFANVVLQSMLSVPLFYNYLKALWSEVESNSDLDAELKKPDYLLIQNFMDLQWQMDDDHTSKLITSENISVLEHIQPEIVLVDLLSAFNSEWV